MFIGKRYVLKQTVRDIGIYVFKTKYAKAKVRFEKSSFLNIIYILYGKKMHINLSKNYCIRSGV